MEIKHFFKGIGCSALVAAVSVFSSSANAALVVDEVTQLIHFDDAANNGLKTYSDVDNNFLFDPTNLSSSTLCADTTLGTGPTNGRCLLEVKNGEITTMTRLSGDEIFTLDSFYFLLNGAGTGNYITVSGDTNGGAEVSYSFLLGTSYDGPANPVVTFYEGANAGTVAGNLVFNVGYIATFGDLFENVSYVRFTASSDAQARLDCVVNTFVGTTTEPQSGYSGGCGSSAVAEPGTLALLGLGLFGLVGFSRRGRRV